jgi:hypothetical protein
MWRQIRICTHLYVVQCSQVSGVGAEPASDNQNISSIWEEEEEEEEERNMVVTDVTAEASTRTRIIPFNMRTNKNLCHANTHELREAK